MTTSNCPSCGSTIEIPAKKSSFPWWAGCLIAVAIIPVLIAIFGILAAIAIPSFVKARSASQKKACVSNMKQIQLAKEQWVLSTGNTTDEPDESVINQNLPGSIKPTCPAGGTYTYHPIDQKPECSVHGTISNPKSIRQRHLVREE